MHRLAALALAALLAGCAQTTAQVRQDGVRFEYALKLAPAAAAGCLSRNLDELVDSVTTVVRALPTPQHHEVIARIGGGEGGTLYAIDVLPSGSGSRAVVHAWRHQVEWQRAEYLAAAIKGC